MLVLGGTGVFGGRLCRLLANDPLIDLTIGARDGAVMVTGGLALDTGLIAALEEDISHIKDMSVAVRSHPDSIYAGAIGAALWGAFRHEKLAATSRVSRAA